MKKQIELFVIALMFYTRIPISFKIAYTDEKLNKATRFLPLIGWIIGSIYFFSFYLTSFIFPETLAILCAFAIGILSTGAFHEDGLADFFDGFGGGWTKEKILEIMKDSRVGTYGMLASILQIAIKFFALLHIINWIGIKNWEMLWLLFVVYHSLARWSAIQLCFLLDYVREDELSKAKPIAKKHTIHEKFGVYFWGLLPLLLLCYFEMYNAFTILPLIILIFYFKNYLKKWIGGYTGDCLGAMEQISEVVILLTLSSIIVTWKFI